MDGSGIRNGLGLVGSHKFGLEFVQRYIPEIHKSNRKNEYKVEHIRRVTRSSSGKLEVVERTFSKLLCTLLRDTNVAIRGTECRVNSKGGCLSEPFTKKFCHVS